MVPSDRQIKPLENEPGWFKISGGLLQEIYQDNRNLLHELEQCRGMDGGTHVE